MSEATAVKPRLVLDSRVRGMQPSATTAINIESKRMQAEGREVFKLGMGQSPFPVPSSVVQSLREHAAEKDYLPVHGLRALREAVAEYHGRRDGVHRSADVVLIGPGSKELIYILQLAYAGDLMLPSPSWVSYAPQAGLVGRRATWMPTDRSSGWRLRPETLRESCAGDPGRPRLLLLNYPCNPTGMTFDAEQLQELAEVARAHRMVVLADEIYGEMHHRGQHVSIARYYPEGTILASGLSKWCGAGGWRLGTFLFPPELAALRDAMATVGSETFTSASAPIQHAAVHAFRGGAEIDDYLDRARRIVAALGRYVASRLRAAGAHCEDPEGAFYLFPDFESHRAGLRARGIHTSVELSRQLLRDTGVAVLPGTVFGRPAEELTFRMAYVEFDGKGALEAVAMLDRRGRPLDVAQVRALCPRVCEAIERWGAWMGDPDDSARAED